MIASAARVLYHSQRFVVSRFGILAASIAALLLGLNAFAPLLQEGHWSVIVAATSLAFLLLVRLATGRAQERSAFVESLNRFEVGILLQVSVFVMIQIAGGPRSWAQPAVYVVVAYLVGFSKRSVAMVLALSALGLQAVAHLAAGDFPHHWQNFLVTGGFISIFSVANLVFMQIEVAQRRRENTRQLTEEIRTMREDARDFRLISTALTSSEGRDREAEETKLTRGAVEAIHQSMFFLLEMLKKSLGLQTCVLLWLDDQGKNLRIKELVTDSNMVNELPIPAQAGALGGIIKNRVMLNLKSPRGSRSIPYYKGPEDIGAFVGVPVLDDGHLRGVLCADRSTDQEFGENEERLLVAAASQALRSIQTERVLTAVEQAKYEHERFYSASTMLNGALTLSQVYDTAIRAAGEIVNFDFSAITLYDRKLRKHTICHVTGEDRERFVGQIFADNAGFVAMAVKNKHFLPAGAPSRAREPIVFTRTLKPKRIASLVVLPLIVQDSAIGTLVFGARGKQHFPKRIREMLGVITNQVAVSIENAKMYKRMEEMATTDGLTSLPNHRTFQSKFDEMIYRAQRHGKPVSLVLTDVDHFKGVNDNYGHPVGDMVLRKVAQVLAGQARKVDLVARYGGEEFAMILEDTDADGAKLFSERVRQELAAQLMSSDRGSFRVTISLGVATYPVDGKEKEVLVERADQALYAAKESGRNRTVAYSELKTMTKACG